MLDKDLIVHADLLDLAYRFAGELVDVEAVLTRGQSQGGGSRR